MKKTIPPEILKVFIEGAGDALGSWERYLAALQDSGATSNSEGVERELLRILENLKGSAAGVGLTELADFVVNVVELVNFLVGKGSHYLRQNREILVECHSFIKLWIDGLGIHPSFSPDLNQIAAKISVCNPFAKIDVGAPARSFGAILIEKGEATPEQVEKARLLQDRKIGQVMLDEGMISSEVLSRTLNTLNVEAPPVASKKPAETIRVSANRIDHLLKIIGELSIHQSIIWHSRQAGQLLSRNCQNSIALSNKIIREVQSQIMSLRLQPVRSLFQRLERSARDTSLAQNKTVQTVLEGADTDMDKAVIEKVSDPLLHMIRNAVDHGLESSEERQLSGKPAQATIRIAANQDAKDVTIEITDDGRGMDPEVILRKAVEKGFVAAGTRMLNQEVFNLIFLPGFSTAEKITEFSGRGVGMDVVNRTVTDLGGSISIRSEIGKGTTFTIVIPMSVSLMDAVVFTVEGLRYVVPMRDLVEVLDLNDFVIEAHGKGSMMMSLRGSILPVEKLSRYLPRPPTADVFTPAPVEPPAGFRLRARPALIQRTEEGMIAFEVDSIIGQQQIVVRALSDQLAKLPGLVGGTILGDGEPGMILGLAQLGREHFLRVRQQEKELYNESA